MLMLAAVVSIDYVSTKWSPVAFRPKERVHLPCRLAGQDGLIRYCVTFRLWQLVIHWQFCVVSKKFMIQPL